MKFFDLQLSLISCFFQWIIPTNAIVCNDTDNWNNGNNYQCNDYAFNGSLCANGYFQWGTYSTGGNIYRYPELNCCACGRGWPVWFVPKIGYKAVKAIPELTSNDGNSSVTNLQCIDSLGNSDVCNMTCKTWIDPIISLTNITDNNFGSFNCTLILQTTNASISYILQIPQDNYLIYFTNWTTNDYNFSCSDVILPSNSSMICRHTMSQCLPSTTTYRCVSSNCIDTSNWTNGYTVNNVTSEYDCKKYEDKYWFCSGGIFTSQYEWTLGSIYKYPEFNCCGCGKGWPLWFVPLSGFRATKALPELTNNTINSNDTNLHCINTYGNRQKCNMICEVLSNPITSITTIINDNFSLFNCTLIINTINSSISYVLRIPHDNYLLYYTNWTTIDYNFSCEPNQTPPNVPMLCRHDFIQCLSTTVTNRYVPPNCVDTPNWTNNYAQSPTAKGWTCFEYEVIWKFCAGGTFTPGNEWTLGISFNFPELNCCACGKGSQSPHMFVDMHTKNGSTISTDFDIIDIYNCSTFGDGHTLNFDLKCLGPSNFTKINITTNTILYNCPLNCFFDRNLTMIDMTQSVNVTRRQVGSNTTYYLASNLFPNFGVITCGPNISEMLFSTEQSTGLTTLQSTLSTDDLHTSSIPTTVALAVATFPPSTQITVLSTVGKSYSSVWQPLTCTNGNIGVNCNVTTNLCQMKNPCLNNGSCMNNSSSSYVCTCIPGFNGSHCEIDIRPCKSWTCLTHGQCNETSLTTFHCECTPGYEGLHCESMIDYCQNITCQNNGQCRPSLLNSTCECTTNDFTGQYCEIKSKSLVVKAVVKKSIGYIAIIAIITVLSLIFVMDMLKYIFKIDPVAKDRMYLARKRRQQQRKQYSKPKIMIRFIYINA